MPVASRMVGRDVDDVVELAANAAHVVDMPGHEHGHALGGTAKVDATCFTHLNGVSIAHAQPAAKCGNVRSDPQNGYQRNWSLTGTWTPLKKVNSFGCAVEASLPRSRRCRR